MSVVLEVVELSDMEDDCILESVTYVNQKCLDKNNYDYIYKENPLLAEFIEKCYDIENSHGMSSVINKSLIRKYNESNRAFKTSSEFKKVLKRSIGLLESDPRKIFSHIKQLCDILNSSSVRRRIKPTTLSTNLKDICPKIVENGILKRKNSFHDGSRLSKVFIIDSNIVEDLTEEKQPINNNIEKRNSAISIEKENNTPNESGGEDDNKLLVPQKVLEVSEIRDTLNIEKVKKIEKEIARCKTVIAKLDEEDVDDDSVNSPYIKSEKLKAKIVSLYERLCNLTGNRPVKRRKISLRVIEGHPKGPVQRLETFLNNNIGPDGDPPFPDFSDVVECVTEASGDDNLGWTKHQILQEARALFGRCGRALQRRRQARAWQDLLQRVQLQRCDDDPADGDPALLERLEENRRAALRKESEILERYSRMQTVPQNHLGASGQFQSEISIRTEDQSEDESTLDGINLSNSDVSHNLSQDDRPRTEASSNRDKDILVSEEINEINVKKEPEEEIEERLGELGDNYTLTVEIDEDPFLIIEISDTSDDEDS